jgi:hypothetical protein
MLLSRTLTPSVFTGLAALLFFACGGDPGSPIPAASVAEPPPASPDAPAAADPSSAGASGNVGLTIVVEGTGRVVSQPAGIDCPGQCTTKLAPGTRVTLTATAAEGWRLASWSGACSGAGSCSFVVASDTTVTGALAQLDTRWDPAVGSADCAAAWGNAGDKLSPCDTVKDDYVVVHKSKRNVALCKSGKLVKNFRSGLGSKPTGDKAKEGDGRTPEGVFYVPRLLPNSSFHKAFLLSYPSVDAATRGMSDGLITSNVRAQILSAHSACVEPPQNTALGGDIELYGNGSGEDWTSGCIALEDGDVDVLWGSIGVNDSIVVIP